VGAFTRALQGVSEGSEKPTAALRKLGVEAKDAVLASLRRSIEGHADARRQPFDEVAWDCLLAAYG
jgi:hypothetical protein